MALPFLEARFSDAIARGSRGGPSIAGRTKVYTASGRLSQDFLTTRRLHRYDVSHGIKTRDDFEEVLAAYHVLMGTPYAGMRFKDWNDYRVTRELSALAHVAGTTWQLQRKYSFGASSTLRDVQKPVAGTVAVFNALGTLLTATVDATTGIVTVPAGTPDSWQGEFDVPVTFADDAMDSIEVDGIAGAELKGLPSIKLEEILL